METRETGAEELAIHWAAIVRECGESGVSVKAYCERNGLSENRYYYWRRKLRDADAEQGCAGGPVAAGFAEVKLVDASETTTSSEIRWKSEHTSSVPTARIRQRNSQSCCGNLCVYAEP